jgi:hypothetical protein
MMKKYTSINSPNLSLTEKVDKLRKAGLADSDIDAVLQNDTQPNNKDITEHNKRVDETVDVMVWQEKVLAVCAVLFFIVLGISFFRGLTSRLEFNITLAILVTIVIVGLLTNIKTIPTYFKNARYFFKK